MVNLGLVYSMARRAQLSVLPRVEGGVCVGVNTGHNYLQLHLFKIGSADSPPCPPCNSMPMTGEHLFGCLSLHVRSQDNYGVLPPTNATSKRRLMSEKTLVGVI
ncbi:hypothetical protein TNCV_707451 [Trichonephila clavipes]|nr:hypothetical protein TNCV_707451 [Trichonephila clavipes]